MRHSWIFAVCLLLTYPIHARVVEDRTFAGVPVRVVRPTIIPPACRLVVLFHGYGSPANPQELARAVPLEGLDAVLAYVNLPMIAGRLPAGGIEELRRVQKTNFVNGFLLPSISGAATELRLIVNEMASSYHLDLGNGIGLFGFSAGGAAALLSLMESEVPVQAAVIVNAPMSVAQNVENWEHTLGLHFQWDDASRQAALRYDVVRQVGRIAQREPVPILLLLQGDADKSLGTEPVCRVFAALRGAYAKRDKEGQVKLEIMPNSGINSDQTRSRLVLSRLPPMILR